MTGHWEAALQGAYRLIKQEKELLIPWIHWHRQSSATFEAGVVHSIKCILNYSHSHLDPYRDVSWRMFHDEDLTFSDSNFVIVVLLTVTVTLSWWHHCIGSKLMSDISNEMYQISVSVSVPDYCFPSFCLSFRFSLSLFSHVRSWIFILNWRVEASSCFSSTSDSEGNNDSLYQQRST